MVFGVGEPGVDLGEGVGMEVGVGELAAEVLVCFAGSFARWGDCLFVC